MRNRLSRAGQESPVLWSCLACSGGGQFLNDLQGRADHQRRFGHRPVAGRPLAPLMGLRR
jgi:hypothetical protein